MRKTALIIWGGVALAACAPLNTYYKPGATVAMVERQTTQCQVDALAQVPVVLQTVRTSPRFIPPRRVCRSDGRCTSRAGYFEPGQTYTVDPSADLRKRVETQCMADAGFAPVSIPQCPAGIAKAAPQGRTTALPALTDNACVIRNDDGSFQIVTRG